jgi:hypothetical protein
MAGQTAVISGHVTPPTFQSLDNSHASRLNKTKQKEKEQDEELQKR